jgi:hypothetical protein
MPSIAIPNPPPPPPSPPHSLDQNLPCLRCGYNLRTLSTDARCPECSAPVASSLNPTLLRYEDPSWTGILALAMGLLLFSASLEFFVICSLLNPNSDTFQSIAEFAQPLHAFASPLTWVAVFLLGKPNPRALSPLSRNRLRRTLRVMALIGFIIALYAVSLSQLFPDSINDLPIQQFVELLATIVLYLYLLHLARRTGLPKLLRHTRIAMIATLFALCDWAFLDTFTDQDWEQATDLPARLALMPIFIYQLYVLFLFHRTLKKYAAFARQHWHFCSPIPVGSA